MSDTATNWVDDINSRIAAATETHDDLVKDVAAKKKAAYAAIEAAEKAEEAATQKGDIEEALKQKVIEEDQKKTINVLENYEKSLSFGLQMQLDTYKSFSNEIRTHYTAAFKELYEKLADVMRQGAEIVENLKSLEGENSNIIFSLENAADQINNSEKGFAPIYVSSAINPAIENAFVGNCFPRDLNVLVKNEVERLTESV